MADRKVYIDLTGEKAAVGIILRAGIEPVYVGTTIHQEAAKYRGIEIQRRLEAECDLHFWFRDETPEVALYTVPKTEVGGYDSRGGLFLGSPDFTLRDQEPMYYLSPERQCFLITEDSGKFTEMGTAWRDTMIPTDAIECFANKAGAMEKYDVKTLNELWDL